MSDPAAIARPSKRRKERTDHLWGLAYALPALGFVIVFLAYPLVRVFSYALTTWNGIGPSRWVGIHNFTQLVHDPVFLGALRNNLTYAISVPVEVFGALVIAHLLHERIPGWKFFRWSFFVPAVYSTVVIGIIAGIVLQPSGPIDSSLRTVGLSVFAKDWLAAPWTAREVIILVVIWANFGYSVLIYLAGMSALDPQLAEAARMDGAGSWRVLFRVHLPSLRGVMQLVLVINTITAFAYMFTYIYVITTGGPGFSTYSAEYFIYDQAFTFGAAGVRFRRRGDPDAHYRRVRLFPDPVDNGAMTMAVGAPVEGGEEHSQRPQDKRVRWVRDHRKPTRIVILFALMLLALSAVFPLYFMLQASFRSQAQWNNSELGLPAWFSLSNFRQALLGGFAAEYLRNSAVVTVGSTLLSLVASTMAGFAFSKLRWRLRNVTYYFVLAWLALPPVVLIVPIYIEMVQLHLLNTYYSVIFLYTALNIPFNTFLMTAFFRSLPSELVEAARMDGASPHRIFRGVMLPLAKSALGTLAIFDVLYAWNEFIFALLLLSNDSVKTLTVGVLELQGRYTVNVPVIMSGLLVASLPVFASYLFFQRFLIRGIVAGAVK